MKKEIEINQQVIMIDDNGLKYIQFKNLNKYKHILKHCFTTRLGGISTGECYSLNMGFNRRDSRENVLENYKRIAKSLDINYENIVFSNQVHEKRIKIVNESDRGKGIIKESDILGYDGLVTNNSGVALTTFYADCVPIFLFDPEKKVISSVHSGWRGTVKEIAGEAIRIMQNDFGCKPENIEAAIGPSIGECCFEVGEEVVKEFSNTLNWSENYCVKKSNDKWHVNLQEIIKTTMKNFGINENRISVAEICTKCNKDIFFSHRGDKGKTGSLVAIMDLI